MRVSVASLLFERRNTTRRLPFSYRLLDRSQGLWLLTRTPVICTGALACKARTDPHYPLPLTANDVGVAGCTTTCSLTDLHSQPELVHESRYFRASLGRYPRQFPIEDEEAELAWIDRVRIPGEAPWIVPLSHRCRWLAAPGRY